MRSEGFLDAKPHDWSPILFLLFLTVTDLYHTYPNISSLKVFVVPIEIQASSVCAKCLQWIFWFPFQVSRMDFPHFDVSVLSLHLQTS